MTDAIVVDDLVKRYGDFEAVSGVTFAVGAGEVVAVLGPNGAGKTSTIEILEGYRSRDGGRVEVLGHDPAERSPALRNRLGVVLQECESELYLTVQETLDQFAAYYPDPRATAELLDTVELAEQAGVRVRHLSGGQRRRLDLAVALVGQPELVFLDEPTTGFDPAARRGAWGVISRLRDVGTTVLLTTHYLDEAEALADRLIVLDGGRIVAEGTPSTIAGRDRTTRIAFDGDHVPDGCPVPLELIGGRCTLDVADAVPALAALTAWAEATGTPLPALEVGRRRLEDVYLELIA